MPTVVIFWDSSALIKLFKKEESGADNVKYLFNNRIEFGLHFAVNERVIEETKSKISEYDKFNQFERFYLKRFHNAGQAHLREPEKSISIDDLLLELELTKGRDDYDAEHIQSILNHFFYLLEGESSPILLTSDKKLLNRIKRSRWSYLKMLNPEDKNFKKELLKLLNLS